MQRYNIIKSVYPEMIIDCDTIYEPNEWDIMTNYNRKPHIAAEQTFCCDSKYEEDIASYRLQRDYSKIYKYPKYQRNPLSSRKKSLYRNYIKEGKYKGGQMEPSIARKFPEKESDLKVSPYVSFSRNVIGISL